MSVLYIKDLIIEAKHGVHQSEKNNSQRFRINIELAIDTTKAGISDDLADTLNWSDIRTTVISTVQNNSFDLVERLAQEVAEQIMKDKRIQKLALSIDKLDAFATGIPGVSIEVSNQVNG